jgi:hypothetical protein
MNTYTIGISRFTNIVDIQEGVEDISSYIHACIANGYLKDSFDDHDSEICFEALDKAFLLNTEEELQSVLNMYAEDGAHFCVTTE